jgi:hypothetical protein
MQAPAVIEALDVLRDGIAGLGLILKLPMPDQLILHFDRHQPPAAKRGEA